MFCNLVILNRYLDNICKNPDEEKFQKVKQGNKVFQVRFSLKNIQDLEIYWLKKEARQRAVATKY